MNRLFNTILVMIFVSSTPAFAGKRCGLGSKLLKGSKSIVSQLSEIFTNGISTEEQSITSGTSGCHHDGNLIYDGLGQNDRLEEQLEYTGFNYEELLVEMAAGSGETLAGLAETFGCRGDASAAFGNMIRSRYPTIVDRQEISPGQIIYNVRETFRHEIPLRQSCGSV
jgi:hypothetical protein